MKATVRHDDFMRERLADYRGATYCFYWRPQRDSNPRTYRERVVS